MPSGAKDTQLKYKYLSTSADVAVKATGGVVHRIIVTASSSGVIQLYDGASTSGTKILDSLSVAAKDQFDLDAQFTSGLWFELVSGTATVTIIYS